MENKLEEYRAKKLREKTINDAKEKFKQIFTFNRGNESKENGAINELKMEDERQESENLLANEILSNGYHNSELDDLEDDEEINCCSYIDFLRYALYFILWATLYAIFIKLEFGIVYLLISSLIIMYLNTRTKPKRKGEVSAYSVFNKDCKSINGTLNAEQLEKQLLFR